MEEKVKIEQTGLKGQITSISMTNDVEQIDAIFDGNHNVERLTIKLRKLIN